jgi:asparagine synthase (glutamine-hydrolysing)
MMDIMTHRGPDDEGKYIANHVGLGHRRLSIIDLDTGRQPISNEDNSIWIVFNGEIYNYRDLQSELKNRGHDFKTNSDTEVIIHLYEEYGEKSLLKLRGMFAFAIFDKKRNRLFIARDRIGIKPLYYTCTKKSIIFASEIKAIIQDCDVKRHVNPEGLCSFLKYSYTPGPETVFHNIYKLQPGHYLVAENDNVVINKYWDLGDYYSSSNGKSRESLEEDLIDLLKESVKLHMISDVPVGFLLSGGVDSTAMLALYTEQNKHSVKTFTIGFEGEKFEDERKYARIAAKKYGVDHYETTVTDKQFFEFLPDYIWFMEEPIFEPPAVSLYYVSKLARKHVKVLISGEGGDEAFAGYPTYRNLVWLERFKKYIGPYATKMIEGLNNKRRYLFQSEKFDKYLPLVNIPLEKYYYSRASSPASLFNKDAQSLFSSSYLGKFNSESLGQSFYRHFGNVRNNGSLTQMLYIDSKTWLPDRLLIKADKITMANSLELRVPLLDHKVLEFSAGLPENMKLRGFTTKYIFKNILKSRLPKEIIKRKKAGFPIPYDHWLRKNRQWVFDVLLDRKSLERGYFNKNTLKDYLLNKWVKTGGNTMDIFNLVTMEMWHRKFIDRS